MTAIGRKDAHVKFSTNLGDTYMPPLSIHTHAWISSNLQTQNNPPLHPSEKKGIMHYLREQRSENLCPSETEKKIKSVEIRKFTCAY